MKNPNLFISNTYVLDPNPIFHIQTLVVGCNPSNRNGGNGLGAGERTGGSGAGKAMGSENGNKEI